MKQVAIISFLWGKHLNALESYLSLTPDSSKRTVIVPSSSLQYYQQAFPLIDTVSIESFLDHSELVKIKNVLMQKSTMLRDGLNSQKWQEFCVGLEVDSSEGFKVVSNDIDERIFQEMLYLRGLDKAGLRFNIELLVLSEDVLRQSRTAVLWAEKRDIPSLHITHGASSVKPYSIHKHIYAKHLAVYGAQGGKAHEDSVRTQIHVTGACEWDIYKKLSKNKNNVRTEINKMYRLGIKEYLVVFGTTWAAKLSAHADQNIHRDTLSSVFKAYKMLKDNGFPIHLIIKDRLSNTRVDGTVELTYSLAKSIGLKESDFTYTGDNTESLVTAADLLISSNSSLSVEAMHVQTPSINLNTEESLLMECSFHADDGIFEICSLEPVALAKHIENLLTNSNVRESMMEKMSKRAEFYNKTAFSGDAAFNIGKLMQKISKQTTQKNEILKDKEMPTYLWETLDALDDNDVTDLYHTTPRLELFQFFDQEPTSYLEIGCGAGATIKEIKTRYPNCHTVGVELNRKAADYAAQFSDLIIDRPLEEVCLEDYGIQKGSINTVILADVLEHMYNPWGALRGILPYLTPDAQVVASIPNIKNLWILNEMINGRWTYESAGLLDITHIRFFTWTEIVKMFDETGYELLKKGRTYDARVSLDVPSEATTLDLGKIVINDLTAEEIEDYKTLQFLVSARPKQKIHKVNIDSCLNNMNTASVVEKKSTPKHLITFLADPLDVNNYVDLTLGILSPLTSLQDYSISPLMRNIDGKYQLDLEYLKSTSLVIIYDQGALFSHLIPYFKAANIPVVFYITRNIWSATEKSHSKESYEALEYHYKICLESSDSIITTNEYLSDKLAKKSTVLTPFSNVSFWNKPVNKVTNDTGKVIVALYTDPDTIEDIVMIAEVLKKLQKHYADKAHFILYAINCASFETEKLNFLDVRYVTIKDYVEHVKFIRSQPVDVVVCPVVANEYNLSRTPFTYFEQSLCQVAGVYSNVGLFRETVQHGLTGYLCNDDGQEWTNAISALIEETSIREKMAEMAESQVRGNFTVDKALQKVNDTFAELISTNHERSIPQELLKSFSRYDIDSLKHYNKWLKTKELIPADLVLWTNISDEWTEQPFFHFFIPVNTTEIEKLSQTIDGFSDQLYPNWYLHFISEIEVPHPVFDEENNLNWVQTNTNVFDAANQMSNHLIDAFIGVLNPGDRLVPHALMRLCHMHNERQSKLIYADHDYIDENGIRNYPQFKPEFNLEMLRSSNYISSAFVIKSDEFKELGGFNMELNGSELFDILLRYYDSYGEKDIYHASDILYSCTQDIDINRELVNVSSKIAISQHLQRNKINGEVVDAEVLNTFRILYYHDEAPLVSILIPTKNQYEYISACVNSIIETTAYKNYEIIIVDNGSTEEDAIAYLSKITQEQSNIKVINYNAPFNYSTVNNIAAEQAGGEYLLLLNNDTKVLHENWLDVLLSYGQRKDVGIVGPRLLFPNNTIQHAGVIIGLSGFADHQFIQCGLSDDGYMARLKIDQELSAVTAAALLIKKSVFEEMQGLNDKDYVLNYSDVDLCLRVREAGYKVLWTPHSTLMHHGSVTQKAVDPDKLKQKRERFSKDQNAFVQLWKSYIVNDPVYNINLDISDPYMSVRIKALPHWTPFQASNITKVFAFARANDGGGFYRIASPLEALNKAGLLQTHTEYKSYMALMALIEQPDVIVYQTPMHDHHIKFLEYVKTYFPHVLLIFEIDDLLTNIPIENKSFYKQYKDTRHRIKKALSMCDRMIVSTQPLKDVFSTYIDDIRVVPNYLPKTIWGDLKSENSTSEKLRVGWAGSIFHKGDLEIIKQLIIDYKGHVQWVFMGMFPEGLEDEVEYHSGVSLDAYPQKLASLNLDLALVPLEQNAFNEAKSNLRLLEFGMLGWPVICTDIYPYKEAPVTRVKNRYKDWVKAFLEKISDRDALAKEGENLKVWVQKNYILEDHLDLIAKHYSK